MKFLSNEVRRVTDVPLWRTQTPTLAGIAPVNPGFLVDGRQRAEDCPPYLTFPLCDFATPRLCVKTPASRHDQGSIKAETPAIKANRASSRQTSNFQSAPVPGPGNDQTSQPYCYAQTLRPPRPEPRNPGAETQFPPAIKAQSRQKPQQSRLIVPNQGKRQIPRVSLLTSAATG